MDAGPTRDGVRGGREQFRWDSVASQTLKDRECYLGQSVKVGIQGRKGIFARHDWWQQTKKNDSPLDEELQALRIKERALQEKLLGKKRKVEAIDDVSCIKKRLADVADESPPDYSFDGRDDHVTPPTGQRGRSASPSRRTGPRTYSEDRPAHHHRDRRRRARSPSPERSRRAPPR